MPHDTRHPDNGQFRSQHRDRSGFGFAELVQAGENPLGFVAQTPNDTVRDASGPEPDWSMCRSAERTMVPPVSGGSGMPKRENRDYVGPCWPGRGPHDW